MSGNRPFRTTAKIATELRHLSLRGYDDCRFGVTTVAASGLRQTPLRGYDKNRCGTSVNTAFCSLAEQRFLKQQTCLVFRGRKLKAGLACRWLYSVPKSLKVLL
ncbi:hypothetical protein [Prevotella nigrescens]|uniref:hypothetical protein n=1 Tax=Prevotella nigrescens TaxID=28133 RepID=UPI00241DEBB5|nr:hypothetical protein [Prevotella nigrescens]